MSNTLPRVLLADDHVLFLEAFQKLLEPHVTIVGTVIDGHQLLESARKLRPDLILLDIAMPVLNGLEASRRLKQTMPEIKLIMLTVNEDLDLATEAFQVGVLAYLLKKSSGDELLHAIREVMNGRTYVTPLLREQIVNSFVQGPKRKHTLDPLSSRQREVLQVLVEGHSMKKAGDILNISARTIAFHKYQIMKTLQLTTNADLIQLGLKEGLIAG